MAYMHVYLPLELFTLPCSTTGTMAPWGSLLNFHSAQHHSVTTVDLNKQTNKDNKQTKSSS